MKRKGIILAGGTGTRLWPVTKGVSKQLLAVFDKPMIYYPLSILMLADIREIAIITTPEQQDDFIRILGDGSGWGLQFTYIVQPSPDGLTQAFLLGKSFLAGAPSAMILGDNSFFGHGMTDCLARANARGDGGTVFAYSVNDPKRYGVIELDADNRALSIEEKPLNPRSRYAVTGLYFYDESDCEIAETIKPSERGELEITELNRRYMEKGTLNVEIMGRGYAWFDTGTSESLLEASSFIASIQKRHGMMVGSPEEIAYGKQWINADKLEEIALSLRESCYGKYLLSLIR